MWNRVNESNNLQQPQYPEAMEACSQSCDGKMIEEEVRVIPEQNDFVAAVYEEDKQWCIGKVVKVDEARDEEDEEVYITFMAADKSRIPLICSWPHYEDKVWVKFKHLPQQENQNGATNKMRVRNLL